MVYRSSTEGGYGTGASVSHVDASHADRIDIPDAELLFRGHFARSGPDLVLTGQDGHRFVVTNYFASEKHPDLVAPNGAHLSGDLVDLLAGSPTHGQYAQAGTTLPPEAIGKVEKVVGHVTLIHNGVAGPLHVGDPVYKTDVIETGANSSAGIAFPDGTALDLVDNTRMALNEYSFEPNGASNGAIFSLVEGTFAFVAGQVAHTGQGMKINTPVATMGIRGTVGLFKSEPTVINANLGHVWSVFLHEDIDGSHHLGRIAVIDQDPTSPTFGEIIYVLDSSEYIAYLEPQGPGLAPHVRLEPITSTQLFNDRHFFDDLSQVLSQFTNPQSNPGGNGSGDPQLPQFFQENGNGDPPIPFTNFAPTNGTNNPATTTTTFTVVPFAETLQPVIAVTAPTQTLVINTGTAISGVTVTETGATNGESFTVTVSDTHGILSANTSAAGGGGTINGSTNGSGTTLTIIGTLSQVNADLTTLTDNDHTPGPDTITVTAIDSRGHGATPVTINVSATGAPSIAVTTPQTIGVRQTDAITSVVISEVAATATETFTVELKDSTGLLSATGATPASNGTDDLIITGTLSQVNADLTTLTDKNSTAGTDNITVSVTDGFNNTTTQQIAVTVNGAPVLTTPAQTIGITQADMITGVSVTESGNTTGETFTATLSDITGVLSATATGGGDTVSSSNSGHTLTITGTLDQVNADLKTLTDTNGTAGTTDPITLKATDGFNNTTTQQIAVTVNGAPVLTTPAQTIGITQADMITGVSVTESGNTTGETFTATLSDITGVLSATATGGGDTVSSSNSGHTLTITGTLDQVNADLKTLTDTNGTAGTTDPITLKATDGFNNTTTQQIAVTVNGAPVLTTPAQTIGITQADMITGVSVTESGNTTGETFTATLSDITGVLSATATGGGDTVSSSNSGHTLTITGTLDQVNADLKTLTDTNGTAGTTDPITLKATDGFNNTTTQQIAVTVNGAPVLTTPAQTIGITQADMITGVSVTESGNTTGETFTATLSDITGVLSATATGGGDTVSSSNSGHTLTITGTLDQVNADLKTLTDTNGTAGTTDPITLKATDGFNNTTTQQIAVTVNGAPVLTTPAQTIGITQADMITGVSVTESGNTTGETFTATLSDITGVLSATATGGGDTVSSSNSGHTLTITGTLDQVNADLKTLTDTNGTAGTTDPITLKATDGFNNTTTQQIAVTVNGAPVLGVPGPQTFDVNEATAITGVSVTESGNTTGETFTVTLSDTHGVLSANTSLTGGGGTITSTNSGHTLTIVGTLGQVYSDLGTLTDTNGTAGSDPITLKATDSFGNAAIQHTIAVTVNQQNETPEPPTLTLGGTTATVTNGTGTLPSITVTPVDSDDRLTVTIAGLPMGATIIDSADGKVFSGSSFTLTGVEAESKLTLNDGSNTGPFTLTVTANNTFPGEAASSRSQTINVINGVGPAGVAGSPINLALTNPSAANGGPVAVTITGVPSDWALNEGTNLGNGTWTVQTNDLSALTVLTAAAYSGAIVLGVTETWTNANGTTGTATVADNVEAYAPSTPIFALSGSDTLTGAGANDVFVFAQPIGNDTVYNFNVATDKIDLTGFANIASFSDIQASTTNDANANAVITLGNGETITLHGVNAASLTAADFVFNQTPVVANSGNMVVSDGAVLPLSGTIDNTGTIALNSSGDHTELQIIGDGVTLEGGGQLILSNNAANTIIGTGPSDTLTNVDNTISGAGQIGSGDGTLTLVNEAHGTIEANDTGGTLTLETSTTITNNGVLEALNGGTLQILDPVTGSGSAIIAGGTVIFDAPSNMHVTFNNGTGTPTYGELVLGDASGFSGQISGFAGTAPDVAHSDAIDLVGINYNSSAFSETYNSSNGLLTVTDGTHAASFTFDNFNGTLSFASDGNGGTLITDPPAPNSSNMSVSIGGPGNDTFVFKPDIGADTIVNFNPQADTIELDHFANVHNVQQLAAAITADAHGDAMIALGHGDSIDIPGVTPSYLQAHLQSLVHLH